MWRGDGASLRRIGHAAPEGGPVLGSPGRDVTTAKVLKVLKVLNFSGAGKSNIFTFTFTGAAAPWLGPERSSPQPSSNTLTPPLSLCAGRGGRQSSAGTRTQVQSVTAVRGQAELDGDPVGRFAAGDLFAHERDQLRPNSVASCNGSKPRIRKLVTPAS